MLGKLKNEAFPHFRKAVKQSMSVSMSGRLFTFYTGVLLEYVFQACQEECRKGSQNAYMKNVGQLITINAPVVYMALDVMVLMGEPFRGPLKGVGCKSRYFFGP
jgi:hypothetical protein